MKTIIETLLRQTGRANIDKLLSIMERHGYYSVPSHNHHQRWAGTLHHSLEKESTYVLQDPREIIGMIHSC